MRVQGGPVVADQLLPNQPMTSMSDRQGKPGQKGAGRRKKGAQRGASGGPRPEFPSKTKRRDLPPPRAVIAAPVFNKAEFLRPALDSLLTQTFRDFALILVDDASEDSTPKIINKYMARDRRVLAFRNETRLGMIANKRYCFELARRLFPEAEFFAWGSDHDHWRPGWLAALLDEMQRSPEAVCVYPKSVRVDEFGEVIRRPWSFETRGIQDPGERLRLSCERLASGFMVYGLYRTNALERVGAMRKVLEPDRLLLLELSLLGEFHQVDEVLWERRFAGLSNPARQRKALFRAGRAPWYTWVSPWVTHAGTLLWRYVVRGNGKPDVGRLQGLGLVAQFVYATIETRIRRRADKRKKQRDRARSRTATL